MNKVNTNLCASQWKLYDHPNRDVVAKKLNVALARGVEYCVKNRSLIWDVEEESLARYLEPVMSQYPEVGAGDDEVKEVALIVLSLSIDNL